jgi:exodeoxyribonuclease VIII
MNLPDCMLDLETLGTGRDAAIISLGALRFNREANDLAGARPFYLVTKMSGDIGTIDPATVLWWMQQEQAARDAIFATDAQNAAIPLKDLISHFSRWLDLNDDTVGGKLFTLWSNGPTFDEMIIRDAADRKGSRLPVSYRSSRCCRTYYDLAERLWGAEGARQRLKDAVLRRLPSNQLAEVKLHALHDCYLQAAHMQEIYQEVLALSRPSTVSQEAKEAKP